MLDDSDFNDSCLTWLDVTNLKLQEFSICFLQLNCLVTRSNSILVFLFGFFFLHDFCFYNFITKCDLHSSNDLVSYLWKLVADLNGFFFFFNLFLWTLVRWVYVYLNNLECYYWIYDFNINVFLVKKPNIDKHNSKVF